MILTNWGHYAGHKCGHTVSVPMGRTAFLTNFGELCKCGEPWRDGEFETFVGRWIWKPKWPNLFNTEMEVKK